ncbi:MAG: EAL domain-containing protein [Anaerostipes sp.]|nr:EAL domain-containing protein [Anaerostipes sp.]MDD3747233.1 EAL domain-containing protein [Anaerostipes sp.]
MAGLRKLLVVDDMKINRDILAKILSEDYIILEAENGKEALRILEEKQEEISAVLLDLVMPIMDGYTFLRKRRDSDLLANIPVIVMTQEDKEKSEIEALKEGANDFLTKPYNTAVIKHRLKNIIRLRETAAYVNAVEWDSLTHVYSKEAFYTRAKQMLQRKPNQEYAFVCMDIADFKLVNDLYGEAEGDKLLKYVARLLNEVFAPVGSTVGRLNGDTFLILVPNANDKIEELTVQYVKKLREYPINMDLNAQFGVYIKEDLELTVRAMCDYAKISIRKIKNKYNHTLTYFNKEIHERLLEEQTLAHEMRDALHKGQFEMLLQPKFDLQTEEIVGAESLVRWNHPDRGVLFPSTFIPLFEKNGFITNLDIYVWEEACKKIRGWIDAGNQPIPISVNVSRADIYKPRLPQIIMGLIDKYEISTSWLHLEITETAYTIHPKQLIDVVVELKELGFHIEMDDFGTGYSSLNMLNEIPVDTIKLDMGFLKNNDVNNHTGNIINFVITLAKWLEVSVVAEGVETKEQFLFLKSMSCAYGQGYYFSRPLQEKDFEHLMKKAKILKFSNTGFQSEQIVQKEEIWIPDSDFNMFFNAYPGALALCEYENGHLNLIRGNENLYRQINSTAFRESVDLFPMIHKEDQKRVHREIERMIEQPSELNLVARFKSNFLNKEYENVQLRMKLLSKNKARAVLFLNVEMSQKS